ncbi:hypothetical protein KSF_075000 [Reticulibacter mediterranei]|uniref:DUF7779 domain-containing protein n=1 Tax=Reticulibacter mediterranei TaxID=2778369 RepID=A0A8J3IVE4_9CHLR|nr:tetratricopeptide repeat-containing protein [Reticulibacter mediterranei]GHO97452.1 hypothetical protein KSF_075000 [Reticulibacter mediterranei]
MDLQNEPDAEKLAKLLGGLPLTLDQAGAYLEETGCSVADYLQRYHQQRPLVLARRGLHGGAHPSSVTTTLQLSMERVEQEHPGAIHLLRACALLHPDAIPEELLAAGASYPGQRLQQVVTDAYQFDVMLSALRSASLIARSPEIHALSMHRLVQAVIQDQMEPTEIQLWSEHMMRVIATCFPEPDPTVWSQCERLLQSALTCLQWLETTESDLPEASELFSRVGSYLIRRGRFDEAEPLLGQAITVTEKCYGPDHAALIPRLLQHGEALYWQGKYGRCEVVWFRALTLCKQYLGPSHVKTAETINNLALAYYGQGKYEQCEQMFYQALSIQERQLGPKSHDVASTLSNLGLLYRDQKKLEQAEKLFQQALHIFEQLFGAEEVHTIYMLNNLANVYRDQRKYEQAEPLYQQVLHAREHISGPEHPDTAITLADMAMCYREQKKYEQAERLYQQVLSLRERILGPEHPELAKTLYDFAVLREAQGPTGCATSEKQVSKNKRD